MDGERQPDVLEAPGALRQHAEGAVARGRLVDQDRPGLAEPGQLDLGDLAGGLADDVGALPFERMVLDEHLEAVHRLQGQRGRDGGPVVRQEGDARRSQGERAAEGVTVAASELPDRAQQVVAAAVADRVVVDARRALRERPAPEQVDGGPACGHQAGGPAHVLADEAVGVLVAEDREGRPPLGAVGRVGGVWRVGIPAEADRVGLGRRVVSGELVGEVVGGLIFKFQGHHRSIPFHIFQGHIFQGHHRSIPFHIFQGHHRSIPFSDCYAHKI